MTANIIMNFRNVCIMDQYGSNTLKQDGHKLANLISALKSTEYSVFLAFYIKTFDYMFKILFITGFD